MTLIAYPSKLSADLLEVRLEGHPLPRPQQVLKLESQSDSHHETVFCEVVSVSLLENKSGETTCKVALKILNGSPDLAPLKATILDQSELAKAAYSLLAPVQHPIQLGAQDAAGPPVDFFRLGPLSVVEGGNDLSVRVSALMQILRGIQPYQRVLLIDPIGVVMSSDSGSHIRAGQHGSLALQQVSGKRFLEVFAETLPEFLQEAGLRTVASILPQSSRGNKNTFISFQSLMALESLTEAPLRNLILQTLYTLMDAKVFAEKPEEVLSFKTGLPSPITILDISMLPDPWKGFFYAEICQRALQDVAGELVLAMVHPEIYLPDWPKWIQQACEEELNYVVVPSPFRSSNSHAPDWKTSANNVFTLSTDAKFLTLKGDLTLGLPIRYGVKSDALMSLPASRSQASGAAWQTPFDSEEVVSTEALPGYPSELRQALTPQELPASEDDSPLEYHTYRDENDYGDADDELDDESDSEDEAFDDDDADELEDDFDEDSELEGEEDEASEESEDDDLTANDDTNEQEYAASLGEEDEEESGAYYSSYLGEQESFLQVPPVVQPSAETEPTLPVGEPTPSSDLNAISDNSHSDDSESDLPDEFNFNTTLLPDDPSFGDQSSTQYQQQEQRPSYPEVTSYTEREQAPVERDQNSSAGHQLGEPQRYSESSSFENYDDDFGDEDSGDFDFDFDATLYEPSWLTPASSWQPSPSPRAARQARYAEEDSYSAPSRQEIEAYRPAPPPEEAVVPDDEQSYRNYSDYEDNEGAYAEQPSTPEPEASSDEEIPVLTRNNSAPKVPEGYFVGERIRHPQYGLGTITKILPMADQVILNITFDQVGKRLLDPSLCDLSREGGEK